MEKKKEIKLDFIETGRMSNDELSALCGGSWVCCDVVIYCGEGALGNNSCTNYEACTDRENLNACGSYLWMPIVNSDSKQITVNSNIQNLAR